MEEVEEYESKSYFGLLPNEILIKILQKLSIFDVIQFCETYSEFEYFLEEKILLNVVDLSKKSGFRRVPSFFNLIKKLRPDFITAFNITYVYWVKAAEIRKCLKKMKNLEELHILGTKVGIATADCQSYRSLKLKKLSVTIEDKDLQKSKAQYFRNVRSLCVQIVSKKNYTFQYRLQCVIKDLKLLEELWVHDITDSFPLDYDHLAYTGSNLKIFAFKALCSMFSDLRFRGLTKVFFNERTGREAYYEIIDSQVTDPRSLAESSAWKVLNELHAETPYGLRDAKRLAYQKTNINEIVFEELNFMHYMNRCCPRYLTAIKEIVSSKNSCNLKKLTLTNCLIVDKLLETCEDNPKKRKRYDHNEPPAEEHKPMINNLKSLKELEIYVCSRYGGFRIYYFIQHFKNLTRLSLEIPGPLNGEFLRLILENCDILETLKIHVVMSNESFNHDFCRYISLAKNLKNLRKFLDINRLKTIYCGLVECRIRYGIPSFGAAANYYLKKLEVSQKKILKIIYGRPISYPSDNLYKETDWYEHYRISMENLFLGLTEMKNTQMERLFLKCKSVDNFGVENLRKFLEKNPKLDFIVIIINSATDSMLRMISDQLKSYKDTAEKVFMAKKNEEIYTGSFPIPDFYKFELMSPHSSVANLNVYENFYSS